MDDLHLTKKAEAYVANNVAANLATTSLLTLQIDRTSRKSLAGSIEALIDMLDDLSPDPDLEDSADLEPSLGWSADGVVGSCADLEGPQDDLEPDNDTEANGDERDASATSSWAKGGHWDENVEDENEHGGDILDEPHDDGIFSGCDNEPWLGWGNDTGQPGTDVESVKDVQDSPDYGCGGFTGEGKDMARQMLRTGRSRRPLAYSGYVPSDLGVSSPLEVTSLTIVGPVITVPGWKGPLS